MIPCKVPWCVALVRLGPSRSTHDAERCAVHGHNVIKKKGMIYASDYVHPESLDPGESFAYVRVTGFGAVDDFVDCTTCNGDGDCVECEGGGEHTCECGDEHECHACEGSGDCPDCDGASGSHDITNADDDRSRASLLSPVWATTDIEERKFAEQYLRAIYLPVWIQQ